MFTFGSYFKTLKAASIHSKISDVDFVNALMEHIVENLNVTDRNGDSLDFGKSRVSELLNNKKDVPGNLRKKLMMLGSFDTIFYCVDGFTADMLDSDKLNTAIDSIKHDIETDKKFTQEQKEILKEDDSIKFLAKALFLAIKTNNVFDKEHYEYILWQKGINRLDFIEGDLFKFAFDNRKKEHNIVVIPVNTTFETHISSADDGTNCLLVSENTLHGMWLRRMYSTEITEQNLSETIDKGLYLPKNLLIQNSDLPIGRKKRYPVGTISAVAHNNHTFYLIAMSEFEKHGRASSSIESIELCLNALLEFYDIFGQGYHMYLPLVGTGRSRAGLSYQESFDFIKKVFINNSSRIHGSISIVATSDAVKEIDLKGV